MSKSNPSLKPALVDANGRELTPREVRTGLYQALSGHKIKNRRDLSKIVPKVTAKLKSMHWHEATIAHVEGYIDDLIDVEGSIAVKQTMVAPGFRDKIVQIVLTG